MPFLIVKNRAYTIVPVALRAGFGVLTHRNVFHRVGIVDEKLACWGHAPFHWPGMYNPPPATEIAVDKLKFHDILMSVPELSHHTLAHLTSQRQALQAVMDGKTVFCRALSRARAGKGIVVARTPEEVVRSKYYTIGVPSTAELRVHFFVPSGKTLELQKLKLGKEKRKDRGIVLNKDVRSHNTGWVFGYVNDKIPEHRITEAKYLALEVGRAIGLSYGCVDFVYTEEEDKLYIVEANSAPGVKGERTVAFYYDIFKEIENA